MAGHRAFSRIEIGRLRGLQDVVLDDLQRFNLVVGGNDSGKTTVLEAAAMLCARLDLFEWMTIARTREYRGAFVVAARNEAALAIDAIRWLFPNDPDTNEPGEIQISGHGATLSASYALQASAYFVSRFGAEQHEAKRNDDRLFETGLHVELRGDPSASPLPLASYTDFLELDFWPDEPVKRRATARTAIRYVVVGPYAHRSDRGQVRSLSRIVESGYKHEINSLLEKVDHQFRDIELVTSSFTDRPTLIVAHEAAGRVPLSVMGDGFRRALSIAIGIVQARNGVLLIDEIEAALHVSVLDDVLPWMLSAAAQFDVQIIATTHSLEAVQVIADAGARDPNNAVNAYRLDPRKPPGQNVRRYTNDMLTRLVRDSGLDIRGR